MKTHESQRGIAPMVARKLGAAVGLLAILCVSAPAQQVGEITLVDGAFEVAREEDILDEAMLDIGSPIENFDRIRTGADGDLYFAVTEGTPAEVHVSPSSTFYVEIEKLHGGSQTTLGLVTGSLALRVQRLGGGRNLNVRTESTTMGVRGTTFGVQTAPGGEILVSCNEGSVVCTDDESGAELVAQPGQVVEKSGDDLFRAVPVAVSDLRTFREQWLAERIEVYRSNALAVTRFYARRYVSLREEFNDAFAELAGHSEILDKWITEDRNGTVGSMRDRLREKREIVGALFRIRRNLFIFERVYYRLLELEDYHAQGYGRGDITPQLTSTEFWQRFDKDRTALARKMARVRYAVKLYAARNDGAFPIEF
jgi:hypothetical protein